MRRLVAGADPAETDLAAAPASPGDHGMGVARLSARAVGPGAVLVAARSEGLFAIAEERRVVLVEDVEAYPDVGFVRQLPAESAVVLLATGTLAPRAGARATDEALPPSALPRLVRELGGAVEEMRPLDEPALAEWLARRASAHGLALGADARRELAARVGGDLERAERELDKLSAYAGGAKVSAADVGALVAGVVENDVFELTRALVRRDARTAIEMVERLLDAGEPPQRLLGLVVWQFRVLLVAAGARNERELDRAAAETGLSRGAIARWRREAGDVRPSAIARAYEALYAADMAIKGGRVDPRTAFQLLALDLCGVAGADLRAFAGRPPRP